MLGMATPMLLLCAVCTQSRYFKAMVPPTLPLDEGPTLGLYFDRPYLLYCEASGQPKPSIRLWKDNAPLQISSHILSSGSESLKLKFEVGEGVYQCEANNTYGIARSDNITVRHVVPHGLNLVTEFHRGGYVEISCPTVDEVQATRRTYTWMKNGHNVSVSDKHYIDVNGNLHILNVDSLDVGNYSCTIKFTNIISAPTLKYTTYMTVDGQSYNGQTHSNATNTSNAGKNVTTSNNSVAFDSIATSIQTAGALNPEIYMSTVKPTQTASVHSSEIHMSAVKPTQTASVHSSEIYMSAVKPTQTASVHSSEIYMSAVKPTQTASVHSSEIYMSAVKPTQTASVHSSEIYMSAVKPTQTASVHSSEIYMSAVKPTQTASVHSSEIYMSAVKPTQTASVQSPEIYMSAIKPTQTAGVHSSEIYISAIKPTQTAGRQSAQTKGLETIMVTKQQNYTYGDNVTIECLCSGQADNGHPTVSWTFPKTKTKNMNSSSDTYQRRLVISNADHNNSGKYTCTCCNSSRPTDSKTIAIVIQADYLWVTKPTPVVVIAGSSARFTCHARWSDNRQHNPNITWYINYVPIDNENGIMIEFENVSRIRNIHNIQCRTTSEHRSMYFNSYLRVIEPMSINIGTDTANITITAENPSIALPVVLATDPSVENRLSWEHIPENDVFAATLKGETSNILKRISNGTAWESLLGTYIFRVRNKYEDRSISFYVTRRSNDELHLETQGPFERNYYLGEILGLVTVVAFLMALGIVYKEREWIKKKWRKRKMEQSIKFRLELAKYNHASRYVKFPAYSDEFPIDRLHFLDTLGEGNFGKVMKAEALDVAGTGKWDLVAVKMCKDIATDAEKENLYHEMVIMRKVPRHINVVTYLSYVASSEPTLLIMEYVPGGNLLQFLRKRRPQKVEEDEEGTGEGVSGEREESTEDGGGQKSEGHDDSGQMNLLSSRDLSSFALQIAKGMAHVASHNIIHRDLAARNVLLGLGNVCKISDFGLSRDMEGSDEYEVSTMGPLPIRWMPPESLTDRLYTLKSDVWSYGVLLWEIVTLGASPYSGQSARQVMMSVTEGKRLEKPDYCSEHVYKLMTQCWRSHPGDRPTFSDLADTIEGHLEEEAEYVQLSNFDVNIYDVIDMGGMDVAEEKV
ncbi:fibroblast growth factor receptor 3-like [Haliotis cracherodii]|uniref:fibroblast growth factor receptor 3-like n=1 Tax=Haliotis cracherodii TaxID=6455 RepID=UPI0039E7B5E5